MSQHRKSNYNKYPTHHIDGFDEQCDVGWNHILPRIRESVGTQPSTIVVECYQGILNEYLLDVLGHLAGFEPIDVSQLYKDQSVIGEMIQPELTDDAIFGKLTSLSISDYFDPAKLASTKAQIAENKDRNLIIVGTGASLVNEHWDTLIYADMARWEIQNRMKANQVDNLGVSNRDQPFNLKYKQGYFIDWRICDKIKIELLDKIDFLLDTNDSLNPKMVTGPALREGLKQVSSRPLRLVPFFDPGPWGGQWMKEVCDLDRDATNYAWCFDCVPEENSLFLNFGEVRVEIPSIDLIFSQPENILGKDIYETLGPEFPIRFDFLDTMDGGNLSLQVHPSVDYIREQFGMTYTQDESYYMLDTEDDAIVYLGLKEDADGDQMLTELREAQNQAKNFDADKFVKTWSVKKHDHVLIPSGTIHCSGKNSMVLEISATPYIFTFKLWDWGRMGLDGKPRPINIEHGKEVIKWERTTKWTADNLVNAVREIAQGDGWREEQTGLHPTEFIETRRHWFTGRVSHDTEGKLNVLNLVEGREAIIESPTGAFEPYVVHYAETFVVPAVVGEYTIRPYGEGEGQECATLKAYVRSEQLKAIGEDLWMMPNSN
ncbi:MAG: class I mannose-6-phosphate isomerase [Cyclobacteriaceae bacterium]